MLPFLYSTFSQIGVKVPEEKAYLNRSEGQHSDFSSVRHCADNRQQEEQLLNEKCPQSPLAAFYKDMRHANQSR